MIFSFFQKTFFIIKFIYIIKKAKNNFGGEGGVRTLAPLLRPNSLANCPLHHLGTSPYLNKKMAEEVGFEPTVPFDITSFQDWRLKPLGHLSAWARQPSSSNRYNSIAAFARFVNHFF